MFMVLLGMTWPGKRVVGISYILEFFPENKQKLYITLFALFDYPSIIVISALYQFVTINWFP